jgi:hypothetical protein
MPRLLWLMWMAAGAQMAIIAANAVLPGILKYREHLGSLPPILRDIFVVHSVYIVGVIAIFVVATFGFAPELAGGRGLGRFMAAAMALFWLCRVPVQIFYYDAVVRRSHRLGDVAFIGATLFVGLVYAVAALQHTI